MKYVDNNSYNAPLTSNPTNFSLITSIGQGSGVSNRTGNSVLAKYIKCAFNLNYNNLAAPIMFRMTVISRPDGATPIRDEIYEDVSSATAICMSPWKKFAATSYKVHFDKTVRLDQYNPIQTHKYDIKLRRKHHLNYTGTSGIDTGPGNFWFIWTAESASASNYAIVSRTFRIGYLDN